MIHILDTGISNQKIDFVNDYDLKVNNTMKNLSISSYVRLFLPQILIETDKVIYFDSDSIIVDDLSKLYSIKNSNKFIFGVSVQPPKYGEYVC